MKKFAGILVPLIGMVFVVGLVAGCGSSSNSGKSSTSPSATSQNNPDYSKSANWLSLPSSTATKKKVDVFYLIDTTYQKPNANAPNICTINDPIMEKGAKSAFSRTATVFETVGNIYAPYFRQVDAMYKKTLPIAEQNKIVGGIPTSDGLAAFDYFIKHYNKGRPFILAGHSLGSNVMANLLSEYMKKNPKVYKRMVVAYVIGYSITPDYLAQNPELKFAEGPSDTGVIVSYNTEAPVVDGTNPVTLPGGIAINPITWTRTEELAPAALSLGSLALNKDGSAMLDQEGNPVRVKHYADAQVNKARGVVICSTADVNLLSPGNALLPKGVYHSFDYPFYYFNLRANADNRVAQYFLKK
jgi:pimeloyl-ACP methyl ester carboxylesterase